MPVTLVGMGYLRAALKRAEGRMKKAVEQAVREEIERMVRPNKEHKKWQAKKRKRK
jgi:hypothetical protein